MGREDCLVVMVLDGGQGEPEYCAAMPALRDERQAEYVYIPHYGYADAESAREWHDAKLDGRQR